MSSERSLDEQLRHEFKHGVAWITLDRPEVQNAISPEQRDRLIDLLNHASGDPFTRCVVITATGKAFCAGADRSATRVSPHVPDGAPGRLIGDVARMISQGNQALIASILDCEKPVIASVNGVAAGIGAHIALASDLVIAADSARFVEVFIHRGQVPDGGGVYLLTRLIGVHKTKELLFFGDAIDAKQAKELGIVNEVTTGRALPSITSEWADRLADGPTRALALTKALVNAAQESNRTTALRDEAAAQEINMNTLDAQEGVRSFLERRPAEFRGY